MYAKVLLSVVVISFTCQNRAETVALDDVHSLVRFTLTAQYKDFKRYLTIFKSPDKLVSTFYAMRVLQDLCVQVSDSCVNLKLDEKNAVMLSRELSNALDKKRISASWRWYQFYLTPITLLSDREVELVDELHKGLSAAVKFLRYIKDYWGAHKDIFVARRNASLEEIRDEIEALDAQIKFSEFLDELKPLLKKVTSSVWYRMAKKAAKTGEVDFDLLNSATKKSVAPAA